MLLDRIVVKPWTKQKPNSQVKSIPSTSYAYHTCQITFQNSVENIRLSLYKSSKNKA